MITRRRGHACGRDRPRRRAVRGRARSSCTSALRASRRRTCARPARPGTRRSTARSRRSSCRRDARPRSDRGRRLGHRTARSARGRCTRACARRCCSASRSHAIARRAGAPRVAGGAAPARASTTSTQVQIDPWPAGSFGVAARGRPPHQPLHLVPARRRRPTTGTPARSRACIAFFDQGAGEVLEVVDLGVVPMPPERGAYLPADVGPLRDRPQAARDRPARRPELHTSTGTSCAGSAGRSGSGFDPYEGLVLHTVGYHDGDRVRPVLHRASIARDGRALRRSRPDARLEERVRRRRVGPRPHGQLAEARVRLPRRRSTTSTRCSRPSRATRTPSSTRSACTRRTTGSSGSTTTCTAAPTRCGARAASS